MSSLSPHSLLPSPLESRESISPRASLPAAVVHPKEQLRASGRVFRNEVIAHNTTRLKLCVNMSRWLGAEAFLMSESRRAAKLYQAFRQSLKLNHHYFIERDRLRTDFQQLQDRVREMMEEHEALKFKVI